MIENKDIPAVAVLLAKNAWRGKHSESHESRSHRNLFATVPTKEKN